MPRLPQKARFLCPSCGASQLEPPHLISTFCRSCGDYFEVGLKAGCPVLAPPPFVETKVRNVHCHRCQSDHRVSAHAENTICPRCNAAISLRDVLISSPTSRPVDTRGHLIIAPSGSLSSSWIVCGSAEIRGPLLGTIRSEGTVSFFNTGFFPCQLEAPAVLIGKSARLALTVALRTGRLEVKGHFSGLVHCRGDVHVRKGGRLEAEVHARSVRVEKGGALLGTCHVDVRQPLTRQTEEESLPLPELDAALCPA